MTVTVKTGLLKLVTPTGTGMTEGIPDVDTETTEVDESIGPVAAVRTIDIGKLCTTSADDSARLDAGALPMPARRR